MMPRQISRIISSFNYPTTPLAYMNFDKLITIVLLFVPFTLGESVLLRIVCFWRTSFEDDVSCSRKIIDTYGGDPSRSLYRVSWQISVSRQVENGACHRPSPWVNGRWGGVSEQ